MKYVIGCLLAVSFCVVNVAQAQEVSCECPKLGCDPCSFSQGVTFFTSKCGPNNSRLKSCGKPTCIAIEQATKECPVPPAASKAPREPVVVKSEVEQADPNAETRIVGNVKVISGSVSITHSDGKKIVVDSGEARVRETDTVESSANGKALVMFDGGNKLHVHEGTAVQVKEYKDQNEPASRKALLQLIKGKIRSQVNQKYNGKTSSYRVMTTAAVAGVRGTDFWMEHNEGGKIETKVEAFEGHVILASLDEKEMRNILKGEGAVFSADMPDPSFKGKDYSEFIQRGKLSPVYKIPADRLEELDSESRVDVAKSAVKRKKVPKDVEICDKPKGLFNQCAWKCVGNAGGEKTCRVELPTVSCVRSRCNGNGQWADETKIPAKAAAGVCPPTGFTVKACDY